MFIIRLAAWPPVAPWIRHCEAGYWIRMFFFATYGLSYSKDLKSQVGLMFLSEHVLRQCDLPIKTRSEGYFVGGSDSDEWLPPPTEDSMRDVGPRACIVFNAYARACIVYHAYARAITAKTVTQCAWLTRVIMVHFYNAIYVGALYYIYSRLQAKVCVHDGHYYMLECVHIKS